MTESELEIQLNTLQKMIGELPYGIANPLLEQLSLVVNALVIRDTVVRDQIAEQLDDIRLAHVAMEFDLLSTRSEKQALEDKLNNGEPE